MRARLPQCMSARGEHGRWCACWGTGVEGLTRVFLGRPSDERLMGAMACPRGAGEKYLGGTHMWESSRGHGRTVGVCVQRAAVGDMSMGGGEEEACELVLEGGTGRCRGHVGAVGTGR